MAKAGKGTEVSGGINAGLDFKLEEEAKKNEAGGDGNAVRKGRPSEREEYTHENRVEKRNVKLNIMVKPSTAKMLDKAVKDGLIKSRNDLINFLLERFFDEKGKNA